MVSLNYVYYYYSIDKIFFIFEINKTKKRISDSISIIFFKKLNFIFILFTRIFFAFLLIYNHRIRNKSKS